MNAQVNRRSFLLASTCSGLILLAPRAHACEFFTTTLRVTHPNTRATLPGATKSAPICMKFDEVTQTERLIGVETPLAQGAEMGGTLPLPTVSFLIPEGKESWLSENTSFVRLIGLKQQLEVGRSYPLFLTFEKAGRIKANLEVDYPA